MVRSLALQNCLDGVSESVLRQYKTKVNVPKNPKVVSRDEPKHKLTPSVFMFQMSMDTEKKLANTRDMRKPQKVELLDMSETTHQKVELYLQYFMLFYCNTTPYFL